MFFWENYTMEKIILKAKEIFNNIKRWYIEYEDKRALHLAVTAWFLTFVVIIVVCRINGTNNNGKSEDLDVVIEAESEIENKETTEKLLKLSDKKESPTTTAQVSEQTSEETTTAAGMEKETIDVSKLDVSTTPIKDDVINGNNFASINSADVKTMSSTVFDSSRLSYGIDVSYHNGDINWAKVRAAGVEYAIIRVGNRGYESGKLCVDSKYKEYIKNAQANGIKVGVYFFSQAVNEAEALEEASLTLSLIKGYNLDLPVVIDWETDVGYRTYSGISRTTMTNLISVYCDTIEKYGYEAMVYMCKDDFLNRINTNAIRSRYKTWVAWYFSEYATNNYCSNFFKYGDLMPDMTFDYNIWQYSCKGKIDGIPVLTDLNVMILPEKVYDITLTVPSETIIVNMGGSGNVSQGISATDSSGKDATSGISITITDSSGQTVNESQAYKTSGKYTVKYYFQDENGQNITKTRELYVRNKPLIYYENKLFIENQNKTFKYTYDESISKDENYAKIQDMLKKKVTSKYYDTVEGISAAKSCSGAYAGFESIIAKDDIEAGTYKITYTANDGKGLSNTRNINVEIIRENTEETTEETTAETTEKTTEESTAETYGSFN